MLRARRCQRGGEFQEKSKEAGLRSMTWIAQNEREMEGKSRIGRGVLAMVIAVAASGLAAAEQWERPWARG